METDWWRQEGHIRNAKGRSQAKVLKHSETGSAAVWQLNVSICFLFLSQLIDRMIFLVKCCSYPI